MAAAEQRTLTNNRLNVVIALSYGSREEIVLAARRAMTSGLNPEELNETIFAGMLTTTGFPDPDLLVRTSGEQRLSNFLLWQAAYAELLFTDVLWPDFGAEDFARAIRDFASRERRFGARPG